MKKILGLCVLLCSASSFAADAKTTSSHHDFYARIESGAVIPVSKAGKNDQPLLNSTKFKAAALYGVSVGYKFDDMFRSEIETQFRNMNYKNTQAPAGPTSRTSAKTDLKSWSMFWNGYVDAKNSTIFTPYATVGIGYSYLMSGNATTNNTTATYVNPGKNTSNFAWNAGIGSKIKLHDSFDLDVAAKYVDLGKVKFGPPTQGITPLGKGSKVANVEVSVGLAYNF